MKKLTLVLLCAIVACALIFFSCVHPLAAIYNFDNDVSDDVQPSIFLNTPASIYYATLRTNFPNNEVGTCGYTAISMLLSYYDSFYSDTFIPEEYDAVETYWLSDNNEVVNIPEAPGVHREPSDSQIPGDYYDLIDELSSTHFQLYLIEYGRTLGINFTQPTEVNLSMVNLELEKILTKYLYEERGFTNEQVYVFHFDWVTFSKEEIREYTIECLLDGIPAIYCIDKEGTFNGHFLIAYDYDASSDMIYYHTGWSDHIISEHELENLGYNTRPALIYIMVNEAYLPHSHSNNYIRQDTQSAVCSCVFEFHPHHTHTYTGECLSYSLTSHTLGCLYCDGATEPHNSVYTPLSSTQHKADCACGYTTVGVHISRRGENFCMACGAPISNSQVIFGTGDTAHPMNNNSHATYETYLSENGIIILSEFDYNLYIAGELTIQEIYRKVGLFYG